MYIDNFFTSIPLLQELKESSINVVGTIGTKSKEYPKVLQNKNLLKQMNRDDFHTVACETTVCTVWPGPPPALPPTPFHGRQHDSVNLVELRLLKFGRCHHCCIGVKGAKRKETGFGCRTCVKRLCRSGCHEQYHRENNIF